MSLLLSSPTPHGVTGAAGVVGLVSGPSGPAGSLASLTCEDPKFHGKWMTRTRLGAGQSRVEAPFGTWGAVGAVQRGPRCGRAGSVGCAASAQYGLRSVGTFRPLSSMAQHGKEEKAQNHHITLASSLASRRIEADGMQALHCLHYVHATAGFAGRPVPCGCRNPTTSADCSHVQTGNGVRSACL